MDFYKTKIQDLNKVNCQISFKKKKNVSNIYEICLDRESANFQ